MNIEPPKWADRFLELFCKGYLLEEIQGDLYEHFQKHYKKRGLWVSQIIYWFQVFHFIRPFAIKRSQNSNLKIMFKYNFLIAIRNLKKQRFYSVINISGLAIAVACCMMIGIFIKDELNYDKHFVNHENIYRISSHIKFNGNEFRMAQSPAPMKDAFKSDIPEIIESGRFRTSQPILIKKGDFFIKQEQIGYADASILNIFKLDFIYGSEKGALEEAKSIVISRSTSEKFFGFENPVDRTIETSDGTLYRVDGVYEDLPNQTHFKFDVLLSMEGLEHSKNTFWLANNYVNYFVLMEGASPQSVNAKIPSLLRTYAGPKLIELAGVTYDDFDAAGNFMNYSLIPMTDIHLHSNLGAELDANGSIDTIYLFGAIGLFILLLACINFMNLATAKSAGRAKEVGMRKVMGSQKRFLIAQFLTESTVISTIAFLFAIVIVYLTLPYFNSFTGKSVENPFFGTLALWPYVLLGILIIGLLAGAYPAFFLSRFSPIAVLKGSLSTGMKSGNLRNVLVIFQFSISIVMILATGVVYKQLQYSQNIRLGFDKEQVVIINNTYTLGNGMEAFRNELLQDSEIENASASYFMPTRAHRSDIPFNREENDGAEHAISAQIWEIDDRYIPTLNMNLVSGRNFDHSRSADTASVVINQAMAERLAYEDDAVGKKIRSMLSDTKLTIIGVVENFYFDSFRQKILPLVFYLDNEANYSMAIRYHSDNPNQLISKIDDIWQKHAPGQPFEYSFMDQEYGAKLEEERRLGSIFTMFSSLAIVIACLGLFALASFTAEQRKKEIGIRKVLGASVQQVVSMLFSSFSKLLLVAILLSVPLGYYLMSQWLDGFVYRTEIDIWLIIGSCLVVFIIAWVTVGVQSFKAARSNPTENLHCE